jgi:hypothetical protein
VFKFEGARTVEKLTAFAREARKTQNAQTLSAVP